MSERRPAEEAAERLFAGVRAACVGCEDLPARFEAGLRVALETLSADPGLARMLTVEPSFVGKEARHVQERWIGRFGDLLREAAESDPRAATWPSFLVPSFLIDAVRHQIGSLLMEGEVTELPRLLPDILEALLAYYFEPGESRRLARAALRGEGRTEVGIGSPRR